MDAHHHLWKYNSRDYGWMDDSMAVLKEDHLPDRLAPELEKTGVTGTIVVQARQTIEETDWLLNIADTYPFIKGVVGWVDLRSVQLKEQLDRFARHSKFVGVRHVIQDEPDPEFMLQKAFLEGIGKLAEYDLSYDLLLYPRHLPNALKLVKQFPQQRFVIDHISKPLIRAGQLEPWKQDISNFAGHSNVFCKISGMVTEADHLKWKYGDFVPFMEVVFGVFGSERIMLGSDWPVCRLASGYEDIMNIPLRFFEDQHPEVKNKIGYQNCIAFYKLKM
jgi:L-fuconolactonase